MRKSERKREKKRPHRKQRKTKRASTLTLVPKAGKISRSTPSRSHTEAGTLRRRAQRACRECHVHKTRCSGDLPRCKRCEAGGLVCEYTPTKRNFTSVSYTSSASGGEGETAPTSSQDELGWTFTSTALSERPPVHDESQIENLIAEYATRAPSGICPDPLVPSPASSSTLALPPKD